MKNQLTVLRYWIEAHRILDKRPTFELLGVFRRYGEEHRRYHALGHIAACLRLLETYRFRLSRLEFAMMVFAIIYHDLVYETVPGVNNEGKSAEEWVYYAGDRYFCQHVIETVKRLILLTKQHRFEPCGCGETVDRLGPIMIDIDMHVLALPWPHPFEDRATPWNSYLEYAKAVRVEYSRYDLPDYVAGRLHFLSTIDPTAVFYTPEMQGAWKRVEENVRREKTALENAAKFFGEAA